MTNVELEQPFRTDVDYYEERAYGIATVNGVEIDEARSDLARRHGFENWAALLDRLDALRDGSVPPTPFMLAYRAVEGGDAGLLLQLLDAHPELVHARGTNGNDLLGMSGGRLALTRLLIERGADVNRGNDYGWTKLHQAGYSNDSELARLLLGSGARVDLFARGDGGTPLVAALFWGHREVAELLGLEPRNLRVAAGLGRLDLIDELVGTPAAGAHREFYRPHGGFPAWTPSDDPSRRHLSRRRRPPRRWARGRHPPPPVVAGRPHPPATTRTRRRARPTAWPRRAWYSASWPWRCAG